jgi:uncharacterized protein
MWTVILLTLSNVFMTFAWYGHLKWFKGEQHPIWMIVLLSWGIAFFEYCLMVPANRMGKHAYGFDPAQLKTMQEIITLVVFAGFSIWFLGFRLGWNHLAAFACIAAAGFFVFHDFDAKRDEGSGGSSQGRGALVESGEPATYTSPQHTGKEQ